MQQDATLKHKKEFQQLHSIGIPTAYLLRWAILPGWGGIYRIHLYQETGQWRALEKPII
jgi:hypothetical protein